MKPTVLIGAFIGAALGAAIWGGITYATGYEIGWVAWGVGLLVGLGAAIAGGDGAVSGGICAILALAAIFAGKIFAFQLVMDRELNTFADENITRAHYEELVQDARDFNLLAEESQYPEFMVSHNFVEHASAEAVTMQEISDFKQYNVPRLQDFQQRQPDYETWKQEQKDMLASLVASSDAKISAVMESLDLFDVLFGLLGLMTAFKVGAGGMED